MISRKLQKCGILCSLILYDQKGMGFLFSGITYVLLPSYLPDEFTAFFARKKNRQPNLVAVQSNTGF